MDACLLLPVGRYKVGNGFVCDQTFEVWSAWLRLRESVSTGETDMFVEFKL